MKHFTYIQPPQMNLNTLMEQCKAYRRGDYDFSLQDFAENLKTNVELGKKSYYQDSISLIDDAYYDYLEGTMQMLINEVDGVEYNYDNLGEDAGDRKHLAPMLSLQKTKTDKEVNAIIASLKRLTKDKNILFSLEPKFDGLSVELVYQGGKLVDAVTRGDGTTGESILRSVKFIPGIPSSIKNTNLLAVRGEIILPISNFEKLNIAGSNPRNLASGMVRVLEPKKEDCSLLSCYAYDIIYGDLNLSTQDDVHVWLQSNGFTTHDFFRIMKAEELVPFFAEGAEWLNEQAVEMDGYVCKLNSLNYQKTLGYTGHHPKAAFAFKYQGDITTTILKDVIWQTGKTGTLTPVALLEAVELGGVTIERATLHNYDFILTKNLHKGDRVHLQRSGDVIPYIIGKDETYTNENAIAIEVPCKCESCGGSVEKQIAENGLTKLVCQNPDCEAKLVGKVLQVVGKLAFDIEGFGTELVSMIVKEKIIESPFDILFIEEYSDTLSEYEGMGKKKIANLEQAIREFVIKPVSLEKIIIALNLPNVLRGTAKKLVDWISEQKIEMNDLENLLFWLQDRNNYIECPGIGPLISQGIEEESNKAEFTKNFYKLYNLNLNIVYPKIKEENAKSFVFSLTGSFSLTREEIVKKLEQLGGKYSENPTKKCDVMFVGEKAGSKATKAEKYGLPIYHGDEGLKNYIDSI